LLLGVLLDGVFSPEGSVVAVLEALKGEGEEGMLNCEEGVEGNKPTPALVRLPRTDLGVEGTEVEPRERLLGVFGSRLK